MLLVILSISDWDFFADSIFSRIFAEIFRISAQSGAAFLLLRDGRLGGLHTSQEPQSKKNKKKLFNLKN